MTIVRSLPTRVLCHVVVLVMMAVTRDALTRVVCDGCEWNRLGS